MVVKRGVKFKYVNYQTVKKFPRAHFITELFRVCHRDAVM